MTPTNSRTSRAVPVRPNGSGASAILSAAIGSFVLAMLAFAADKSAAVKNGLIFYKPTGALSGVTTTAIFLWLIIWGVLEWRWGEREVALKPVNMIAFTLLILSLLLTFPPVVDLL